MKTLTLYLLGMVVFSIQMAAQTNPAMKSFLSKVERIRKAQEVAVSEIEADFKEEFKKLKESSILDIEEARKEKMTRDDLESALALRNVAQEIENMEWESSSISKRKRTTWEFKNRNGNRLEKKDGDVWRETLNPSFVWEEKKRDESCIHLYDSKRDIAGRLYDNGFFVQFPSQRTENSWNLLEGEWVR